jgi:hypothetical protein
MSMFFKAEKMNLETHIIGDLNKLKYPKNDKTNVDIRSSATKEIDFKKSV